MTPLLIEYEADCADDNASSDSSNIATIVTLSLQNALSSRGGLSSTTSPSTELSLPGVPPVRSIPAFQFSAARQAFDRSINSSDQPPFDFTGSRYQLLS